MFLTSLQSYVANNESCNSNVTIKTSIINQGHNNIDKSQQPAATRNSESGMGILVECSPDPPAIWQHLYETGPSTELPVLCVRVYSAVQCSTVLYTLYVLYYCGCMYLGWAGTGDLPSWPRVPGVGGPAVTRYIYIICTTNLYIFIYTILLKNYTNIRWSKYDVIFMIFML